MQGTIYDAHAFSFVVGLPLASHHTRASTEDSFRLLWATDPAIPALWRDTARAKSRIGEHAITTSEARFTIMGRLMASKGKGVSSGFGEL
jgi:hypothetical protein